MFRQKKCRYEQQNSGDRAGNDRRHAACLHVTNDATGDRQNAENGKINLRRFHLERASTRKPTALRCPAQCRDHRFRLQRPLARVVVEFNLPSPETMYDAPAVVLREVSNFRVGHVTQNSQLRRLGDEILGLLRKCLRDLRRESWQILVHLFRS